MSDSVDAAELAALFRLASRLLLSETDDALAAALRAPAARVALDALVPGFEAWITGWNAERAEEAAVEYAGLFLVPSRAALSLRVGAWLPEDDEDVSSRIGAAMAPLGLDATGVGAGNVPPDHVGVVLALIADLLDAGARDQVAPLARKLLSPWVGDLADLVRRRAAIPLYPAATALVVQLVALAAERHPTPRVMRPPPESTT